MWLFDMVRRLSAHSETLSRSAGEGAAGRRAATLLLTVAALAALSACGFRLRGVQQLEFPTIAISAPPNSPVGAELSRNLRAGTRTQVVKDPKQAAAVLDLLGESRDRQVLTYNSQGRAVEYTLHLRLRFRLRDTKGGEFIEPTELHAQRDISFNDTQVLSKESEEALLFRDMQTDLIQQILRRVAAAKPVANADAIAN